MIGPALLRADPVPHGIATPHPLATAAGVAILADGGNAFDAAVAVSAVLAVVEPYGSGLGGGGFWLLHDASEGRDILIDGRERAPAAATAQMFIGPDGEVDRDRVSAGPLAAAIPGTPAALDHIAHRYGELTMARALEPAIRLARDGFPVDERYRSLAGFRLAALRANPEAAAILLRDGEVPEVGTRIRQPALAATLERLARSGHDGFYDGEVARRLVAGVRAAGGLWTREDLRAYEIVGREPITASYRGMRLVSAPPPSSGGIALTQILQILELYQLSDVDEAERVHLIVEAMRRAYHDRARFLGDADFVAIPIDRLLAADYAAGLAASIRRDRATPSELFPGPDRPSGGQDTTHFSIIDRHGHRVAATLSLNYPFGAGFMPEGTGVLLNNHMDDFTVAPGQPNAYGLIQSSANRIEPGKRMLSSMSPTFVEQDGRIAVIGTPGGSRIISTVLLAALAFEAGGSATDLVAAPRFHHQFLPDRLEYEPDGLSEALREALVARGHQLRVADRPWGNSQAVVIEPDGVFTAAADPRGIGTISVAGQLERP
ncbi:gamma-glutamyltransferase [Thioalkalicoccus limnaeus]|uniref:Glutathione hydrolase proenzyme n=1 Tax=Thioalkalicoccus limnaeus TaxID=120681 RepID=A0ABV4BCH4_9GAMM